MKRLGICCLMLSPLLGCASVDPSRHDSTAYPSIQKAAAEVQTNAAAGLAVSPNPVRGTQTCTYDTAKGVVIITIPDTEKCSIKPPE
jgi:hypothetical protein